MNSLSNNSFESINHSLEALGGKVIDPSKPHQTSGMSKTDGPKQRTIVKIVARVLPKLASKFENYNVMVEKGGIVTPGSVIKDQIANIRKNLDTIQSDIKTTKDAIKMLDLQIKDTLENHPGTNINALVNLRTQSFEKLTEMKTKWTETKGKIAEAIKLSDLPFLAGTSVMVQLGRTEKKLEAQFDKAFPTETGNVDWYKLQSNQDQIKGLLGAIETLKTLDFTGLSISSEQEVKAKENKIRDLLADCIRIYHQGGEDHPVDPKTEAKYTEIFYMVPLKYHEKA